MASGVGTRWRPGTGARVVFVGARKQPNFVVESYPDPAADFPLQDGEILLRMRVATICQEDLEMLEDEGPESGNHPRVLGHEGVGVVVSSRQFPSSSAPAGVCPGDRLIFSPWSEGCVRCPACKVDMVQRCSAAQKYGHQRSTRSDTSNGAVNVFAGGTFASHLVLRKGTRVCIVPQEIPDALAAPVACCLAPLVKALGTLNSQQCRGIALVQGGSVQGAYACALLHEAGFAQVFCHDLDPEALKHIVRFKGIPVQEHSAATTRWRVRETTQVPGAEAASLVLRLSGSGCPLGCALGTLRPGGTLLLMDSSGRGPQSTNGNCNARESDLLWEAVAQKGLTVKGVSGCGGEKELCTAVTFLHKTLTTYPYEVLMGPMQSNLYDFRNAVAAARSYRHCRVPVLLAP